MECASATTKKVKIQRLRTPRTPRWMSIHKERTLFEQFFYNFLGLHIKLNRIVTDCVDLQISCELSATLRIALTASRASISPRLYHPEVDGIWYFQTSSHFRIWIL